MAPPKLTEEQKRQLHVLEPELKRSVVLGDYKRAKEMAAEIQRLLRPTGHETRLMKAKAWLFEAAMEAGELQVARSGFRGIRKKTPPRTRVHLEATALLAICLIRANRIQDAEPYVAQVLRDEKVIRSERQRREFRLRIKERFEREGALAALRGVGTDRLDSTELQEAAGNLIQTKSEDEILTELGSGLPEAVVRRLLDLDDIVRRALPAKEILYLPKPKEIASEGAVGRSVFGAFRTVLYRSLCDPKSDVYKAWFNEGFGVVLGKKYIAGAVTAAMAGLGIGLKALAVPVIALVIKFGIEVFCEQAKPTGVMSIKAKNDV